MPHPALPSEELKRIARLARVGLRGDELERLSADLERVLAYAEEVSSSEAPSTSTTETSDTARPSLRPDRPRRNDDARLLESQSAPMKRAHVLVPRVL